MSNGAKMPTMMKPEDMANIKADIPTPAYMNLHLDLAKGKVEVRNDEGKVTLVVNNEQIEFNLREAGAFLKAFELALMVSAR